MLFSVPLAWRRLRVDATLCWTRGESPFRPKLNLPLRLFRLTFADLSARTDLLFGPPGLRCAQGLTHCARATSSWIPAQRVQELGLARLEAVRPVRIFEPIVQPIVQDSDNPEARITLPCRGTRQRLDAASHGVQGFVCIIS